ncbi:hypothetical protein [Nitrosopumilus sp.]|uniref:hypothetical protein n=1 Tax=Nitrosopumilus sp. TaxID=2024843 RepID=UPI0034A058E6
MSDEIIAVRAYTVPKTDKGKKPSGFTPENIPFDRCIVWDTETTTDNLQNLKFGYFEIWQYKILEYVGIFYDPKIVSSKEQEILKQYCIKKDIRLYTLVEFRRIFLYEVYDLETLCIGFNLPFDLTRIPINTSSSRVRKKDVFSLFFTKNLNYPRLHLTHVTSTLSFINWSSIWTGTSYFTGNFLDLRTLCHALTDKKHTLESACHAFNTDFKKFKSQKHGKITDKYIDYCINDVKSTHSLFLNAKKEFDTYELDIPITRAFTPATIGKEFLRKIGVLSFFEKNPEFPFELVGKIMSGYIGGRVEDKIRMTPTMVDVLDFLSMYPTVCTLQNLWQFVIAEKIIHIDATKEIQDLIDNFTIKDVQNKTLWKKLQCMVQIIPDEDVLPIRAPFGDKYSWNIGTCTVSGTDPMWYPLADVLQSKIHSGKTPKIIQAIKFVPHGVQKNLKNIKIHGIEIDPYKGDLFKNLIEYRETLKQKRDSFEKDTAQYQHYDRKQQIIKIITNAISYGIFVEINTFDESKKVPIDVYGLSHFENKKTKTEKAGYMFNPIIAVSITSSARLLLSTTEALLEKHGTTHAYCDTDSMMIPPQYTKEIQEFFQPLNPYNFDAKIFKLEYSKKWFYGISSKRYCLYDVVGDTIAIDDDKYSAHGLGHLLDPFKNNSDDESKWHKEIWSDIINLHYNKVTQESLVEKYSNKYALQQLGITTPSIQKRFKEYNDGKDYSSQIKPSNFAILGFSNIENPKTSKLIKPFAPYQNPAKHAVYEEFVDYNDPDRQKYQGIQHWKPLWDTIEEYMKHPESKFDGDVGVLERKHVWISSVVHIGKESNGLDESELFGLDASSYEIYQNESEIDEKFKELAPKILELKPKDVKDFGISKQTLWNIKNKIKSEQSKQISNRIKFNLLNLLC